MGLFIWQPSYQTQLAREPRVLEARMGDGYVQRQTDGIQANPQVWDVVLENRTDAEADAIEVFFNDHGGVNAFDWTPPRKTLGNFRCKRWTSVFITFNSNTITAQFEQVF